MAQSVSLAEIYAAFYEVDDALRRRYVPAMDAAVTRLGVDPHDLGVLMAVVAWEPQPTTAWLFGLRGPYTSLAVYEDWLQTSASRGMLAEIEPGAYRVTGRGREVCRELLAVGRQAMEPSRSFPREEGERFAYLLKRLGEACLSAPPPPEKWCIAHSHFHYPGDAASVMGRIDQWLTDLRSFRDDAHLAAWRVTGLSGPALEAFTCLWRGEAVSLDAMCEKLKRRGHLREVYAAALAELRARGWLVGSDDAPPLTDTGRQAREQIEQRTDELFFRPWSTLSADEQSDLLSLARAVCRTLQYGEDTV